MIRIEKLRENEIDPSDIWKDDNLDREKFAGFLEKIICNSNTSLVLTIEAKYGDGKTFFLKRFNEHLNKKDRIKAVYLNAWETDYVENPLIPVQNAIMTAIPQTKELLSKSLSGFIKVSKTIARNLSVSVPVVSVDGGKILEDFSGQQDELKKFKEELKAKLAELDEKVVVLIDELDRCRPSYAIELLEVLKHFFDLDGIYFVLAVNETVLKSAVASVYCDKVAEGFYLEKFIDYRFNLPKSRPNNMEKHLRFLSEKYGIEKKEDSSGLIPRSRSMFYGLDDFETLLRMFIETMNITLRQLEHIYRSLRLFCYIENNKYIRTDFLAFLLSLKIARPDLYQKLYSDGVKKDDIEHFFKITGYLNDYAKNTYMQVIFRSIYPANEVPLAPNSYAGIEATERTPVEGKVIYNFVNYIDSVMKDKQELHNEEYRIIKEHNLQKEN